MIVSPTTTLKDLFLEALSRNDVNKVRQCLILGANVNWKNYPYPDGYPNISNFHIYHTYPNGMGGLHIAARKNFGELLELLLRQPGVHVNIKDNNNMTPLIWACFGEHENIVRRLCQVNGIDPNCRDNDGHCAVTVALTFGYADILKILLSVPHLDLSFTDGQGINVA